VIELVGAEPSWPPADVSFSSERSDAARTEALRVPLDEGGAAAHHAIAKVRPCEEVILDETLDLSRPGHRSIDAPRAKRLDRFTWLVGAAGATGWRFPERVAPRRVSASGGHGLRTTVARMGKVTTGGLVAPHQGVRRRVGGRDIRISCRGLGGARAYETLTFGHLFFCATTVGIAWQDNVRGIDIETGWLQA